MAPSEDQLKTLFSSFDSDGSGFVELGELEAALKKGGKSVTTAECEDLLTKIDTSKDGKISFEEFVAIFALAPNALPIGVKQLVDVSGALLSATDPTQYAGLAQSISSLAEAAAALRKLQ